MGYTEPVPFENWSHKKSMSDVKQERNKGWLIDEKVQKFYTEGTNSIYHRSFF